MCKLSRISPKLDVQVLHSRKLEHSLYTKASQSIASGVWLIPSKKRSISSPPDPAAEAGIQTVPVKISALRAYLQLQDWATEGWNEWIVSFAIGLLKCSPSYARECSLLPSRGEVLKTNDIL